MAVALWMSMFRARLETDREAESAGQIGRAPRNAPAEEPPVTEGGYDLCDRWHL
jgi:hypothetical protein